MLGIGLRRSYERQSKAIYWDGRNEFGDRVGSGVYFYHLSAGELFGYAENGDSEVTARVVHPTYRSAGFGSNLRTS